MSTENLPPEPERPSTKAAERLAVIVDAAERAALSVIDDAEKEAQRYLDEAKTRADSLAAERLRETADELEQRGADSPRPPALKPVEPMPRPSHPSGPANTSPGTPGREAEDMPVDGEAQREPDDDPPEEVSETFLRPVSPPGTPGSEAEDVPVDGRPAERLQGLDSPKPGSAAARLLATQMAVSGSSRKEIEMRLRSGFEIEDTGEILDAILGPEE